MFFYRLKVIPKTLATCHFKAQRCIMFSAYVPRWKRCPARWQAAISMEAQHTGNYHLMEAQHSGRVPIQLQAQHTGNYHFNGGATLRQSAISNAGAMEVSSAGEPYRNNKASTSDRTQSRKQKELILKPKFHCYWISRSIRHIKKNYVRPT